MTVAWIRMFATVRGAITISGLRETGNHQESSSWLTGSSLRGALAAVWPRNNLGNEEFLDYFCRGKINFHGLFPILPGSGGKDFQNQDHFRSFRMPFSAFCCKYEPPSGRFGHPLVDQTAVDELKKECSRCGAPLKQYRAAPFYYSDDNDSCRPLKPQQATNLYHGTDRNLHRAHDEALFSRTVIVDGEKFMGWLSGSPSELQSFQEKLKECTGEKRDGGWYYLRLRTGRGKKRRGYLDVTMEEVNEDNRAYFPKPKLNGNKLVLVLQTPAILRDAWFRPLFRLQAKDVFGELAEQYDIQLDETRIFAGTTLVEGWSGIHCLPRPPEQALAAGSVFPFTAKNNIPEEERETLEEYLWELQNYGIGERLNEGFGRFLVNPPLNR